MKDREAVATIARALGVPFIDLGAYAVSAGLLRKIPKGTALAERCVPVVYNRRRAVFAVDDPSRLVWLSVHPERLGLDDGQRLGFALTTAEGLDATLRRRAEIAG